jgi:hypothetical protein
VGGDTAIHLGLGDRLCRNTVLRPYTALASSVCALAVFSEKQQNCENRKSSPGGEQNEIPLWEVGMRFASVILASLLALGCGTGPGNDPHGLKTSTLSPPSITELVPNSVPVNSVPFFVTINGTNFLTDATVVWNGAPLSTTFVSSNQLMAVLETTDLQNVGLIRVYVRTGGLNSNTVDFDVTPQ